MIKFNHRIINSVGLHARPGKILVKTTKSLDSEILISYNQKTVSATSLIKVIALGATTGSIIEITINGGNEQYSYEVIKKLLDENV